MHIVKSTTIACLLLQEHRSPSPLHISNGMTSHTLVWLVAFACNFKLLHFQWRKRVRVYFKAHLQGVWWARRNCRGCEWTPKIPTTWLWDTWNLPLQNPFFDVKSPWSAWTSSNPHIHRSNTPTSKTSRPTRSKTFYRRCPFPKIKFDNDILQKSCRKTRRYCYVKRSIVFLKVKVCFKTKRNWNVIFDNSAAKWWCRRRSSGDARIWGITILSKRKLSVRRHEWKYFIAWPPLQANAWVKRTVRQNMWIWER